MDPKTQGAALLEKLKRYEAAADPGQRLPPRNNNQGGSEAGQFPARYYEPDDGDDVMHIKDQLASAGRPAPVTDNDVATILRKRAAVEVAKQEDWFQNSWKFASDNPVQQRWAQQVFPEYFSRREQVIDEQTLLQNQLAKIKLRGPRSREDIDLLYAIDMGVVKVEDSAIWNITGTTLAAPRRGLFSPRRVIIGDMNAKLSALVNPLNDFPGEGTTATRSINASGVSIRSGEPVNQGLAGYRQ